MPKRPSTFYMPKTIPPLILVDTGERCIIEGKRYRILAIERAKYSDVNFKNITSESIKKNRQKA